MELYPYFLSAIETEYDLLREIKSGPRGKVSLVRHRATGTRYLFRQYTGSCAVYQKLLTLSSPYMPRILEAAQQGEQAAVLEEYVVGDNLAQLLKGALFTPKETRKILRQVCEALWVLHSMGAVHRDVKPENIILRGADAVLVDYDAARFYKEEQSNDTRVLGTTGYAAPEQYGISQSDYRADIYAAGVLINILLTGKHPSVELAGGHLGRVVQRCTMMAPEKRYKDVLHLMEAL